MPPKVIGPYRVLDTLGSGGAGTVYRALDRRTGDPVALKLLSTGPALDPRAGVEEEHPVADHHGGRRPRGLGQGPWRAGAQHDDDGALRRNR